MLSRFFQKTGCLHLSTILTAISICAVLFCAAPSAEADEMYSYTGQAYALCTGTYSPCAAGDLISGSFTVASAIPDSKTNYVITPESFSFMDGTGLVINSSNTISSLDQFIVSTTASGAIDFWSIYVTSSAGYIRTQYSGTALDESDTYSPVGFGEVFAKGNWRQSSVATTPEPSSIALMMTGLLGICLAVRKSLAA